MLNLSDDEKRKLIEFKDDDDPGIRAMKAELQLVMDMEPDERKYFYQQQRVHDEEKYLQWMIDCNQRDDEFIAYALAKARAAVRDYEMLGDESVLETAEQWAETGKLTKQSKYTIADIRKQRERIWHEKKKLNKLTKPSTEPKQS